MSVGVYFASLLIGLVILVLGERYFRVYKMKQNTYGINSKLVKLIGKRRSGPNCWNATKVFHDSTQKVEYTAPSEMDAWLSQNTIEVSDNEIRPGDILVLRCCPKCEEANQFDSNLVHTAVVLEVKGGSMTMFHKYGYRGPYEIVNYAEVFGAYEYATDSVEWRRYDKKAA